MCDANALPARLWVNIIFTVAIGLFLIFAGDYLWGKVTGLRDEGNERIVANYYLPIQNPHDSNEMMALDVRHDAPSFFAQKSYIDTYIVLHPDPDYRNNTVPFPSDDPRSYYIAFEGTSCINQHAEPYKNFDVGYSCILLLEATENGQAFEGYLAPIYHTEGTYPLLLGTGLNKTDNFTSSVPFVKIQSVESLREINFAKVDTYSNVLSIAIATSIAIVVLLWTRK